MIKNMVEAYLNGMMVENMLEIIKMIMEMVMEILQMLMVENI